MGGSGVWGSVLGSKNRAKPGKTGQKRAKPGKTGQKRAETGRSERVRIEPQMHSDPARYSLVRELGRGNCPPSRGGPCPPTVAYNRVEEMLKKKWRELLGVGAWLHKGGDGNRHLHGAMNGVERYAGICYTLV